MDCPCAITGFGDSGAKKRPSGLQSNPMALTLKTTCYKLWMCYKHLYRNLCGPVVVKLHVAPGVVKLHIELVLPDCGYVTASGLFMGDFCQKNIQFTDNQIIK